MPAARPASTPVHTVLYDGATHWHDVQLARGEEEHVGRRFRVLDVIGGEESAAEPLEQTREPKFELHTAVTAARGDARGHLNGVKCVPHPVDGGQFALADHSKGLFELGPPVDASTDDIFDLRLHVGGRPAHEALNHLGLREWPTNLGEYPRLHHHGESFAVDQHAVTVKYDEVVGRHRSILRSAIGPARRRGTTRSPSRSPTRSRRGR